MSNDNTLQEIKELYKQIEDKKKGLRPLFENGLVELFGKYPNVTEIRIHVNNHEFNDGDPTYFSLYYDDLGVYFNDDSCVDPMDSDEGTPPENAESIQQEFAKHFKEFDIDDLYETMYGDSYESLVFSVRDGKLKSES